MVESLSGYRVYVFLPLIEVKIKFSTQLYDLRNLIEGGWCMELFQRIVYLGLERLYSY